MPAEGQNSSSAHWELYHRLKAEGRLNLLFRLSDTAVALLPLPATPAPHSNVLPFISRAQQLAWRHQWRLGRFVRLACPAEDREVISRQLEAFRQADAKWEMMHGPVPGGARILRWRHEHEDSAQDSASAARIIR